mgnify:CR=1 FL=1
MKSLLFILAFIFVNNTSFAQSKVGYKYNYEIRFDVAQFVDKEPKNTVRKFVDYLFEEQNQKFNVQTRYSEDGVIYISSNIRVNKCVVEDFFQLEKSEVLSFKEILKESKTPEKDVIIANN